MKMGSTLGWALYGRNSAGKHSSGASLVAQMVKKKIKKIICLQCRRPGFNPRVGKITWRRKWQPTPVFVPEKSQGQRSLVGYSSWGHQELDTTERLTLSLQTLIKSVHLEFRNDGMTFRVKNLHAMEKTSFCRGHSFDRGDPQTQ